ncbi:hypothetical protein HOC35_00460 [Candidatus Woesearchaeota archaeon]|jgi:hypothetical protein|nr:hypothetical protein [Candidatus Woesearchaeota archaeon]
MAKKKSVKKVSKSGKSVKKSEVKIHRIKKAKTEQPHYLGMFFYGLLILIILIALLLLVKFEGDLLGMARGDIGDFGNGGEDVLEDTQKGVTFSIPTDTDGKNTIEVVSGGQKFMFEVIEANGEKAVITIDKVNSELDYLIKATIKPADDSGDDYSTEEPIVFNDQNLLNAVCSAIDKEADCDVYPADVVGLTELNAEYSGIVDLTGCVSQECGGDSE